MTVPSCSYSYELSIHNKQVLGAYTYHPGQTWRAEPDAGSLDGPIKAIAAADNTGADLNVFLCKDSQLFGVVGLAWVGTMCQGWPGYNAGVNEKRTSVLGTSEVSSKFYLYLPLVKRESIHHV